MRDRPDPAPIVVLDELSDRLREEDVELATDVSIGQNELEQFGEMLLRGWGIRP